MDLGTPSLRRTIYKALVVFALALGAVACGDEDGGDDGDAAGGPEGTFVGKVEGTDAYIGLVTDGEQVSGYVCEPDLTVSLWLEGEAADDSAKLKSRQNGNEVGEVSFSADEATGTILLRGGSPFTATRASGEAGLYRAYKEAGDVGSEAGAVVLADGSFRGAQNQVNLNNGSSQFIEPIVNANRPVGTSAGQLQLQRQSKPFVN